MLLLYFAWFLMAVAASTWQGGSFDVLLHRTVRSLLLYVAIVVLVSRKREFMRLAWAIALGNLFLVSRALLNGGQMEGRLVVGKGTFGDPNALAMYAIFGLFLWLLIARRLPFILRFVPLVAVGLVLLTFGKTGSRGGLVALSAAVIAHFWNSSLATKLRLAGATVLLMVLALFLLPGYLRTRFFTFFSVDSTSQYAGMLEGNDVGSTLSRQELAWQAYELTLKHPLLGVGPAQFGNVVYKQHKAGNGDFLNQAIHNSYLQVSAEIGIPGAAFFIAALVVCLFQKQKNLESGRSNPPRAGPMPGRSGTGPMREYMAMSHYARLTLIFVAAFGVTLSFAYDDILMMAMGLLTAATNVATNEAALESHASRSAATSLPVVASR